MTKSFRFSMLGLFAVAGMMALSKPAVAGFWCDYFGLFCNGEPDCGLLNSVADFGENPGELEMCAYVPSGLSAGRPLVVALHGCAQQAKDYGDGPGWSKLADEYRFALLLPQQTEANNKLKCFNWFELNDVRRHDAAGTTGEAASI